MISILWEYFFNNTVLKIAPLYTAARSIKHYETSMERIIVCVRFLTRCLRFKTVKHFSLENMLNKRRTLHCRLTFSLHQRRSIFACTDFRKYMGLDISRGFIFANEKDFTSKYTEKSGTIF